MLTFWNKSISFFQNVRVQFVKLHCLWLCHHVQFSIYEKRTFFLWTWKVQRTEYFWRVIIFHFDLEIKNPSFHFLLLSCMTYCHFDEKRRHISWCWCINYHNLGQLNDNSRIFMTAFRPFEFNFKYAVLVNCTMYLFQWKNRMWIWNEIDFWRHIL